MQKASRVIVAAGVVLTLAGCSYTDEVLWPGATGESVADQTDTGGGDGTTTVAIAPSEGETAAGTVSNVGAAGTTAGASPAITSSTLPSGGATGTVVGMRVAELQRELGDLQRSIQQNAAKLQELRAQAAQKSQSYNASVSDVRSRLQVGTTPGNPEVIALWNSAQARLDQVNADIGPMTNLASSINNNVTMSSYLLSSVQSSFNLAGGVDADHRNLEKLENAATEALQQASQMQVAVNGEITQQAAYVSSERQNMTTLALAIDKGHFLNAPGGGRSNIASATPAPPASRQPATAVAERRPLVMIRFDNANVDYEDALFSAASEALKRFPNAQFDLVAVAPAGGTQAQQAASRRYAEQVMRSLTDMGVPAQRVTMSATASPSVATEEVHVYVR